MPHVSQKQLSQVVESSIAQQLAALAGSGHGGSKVLLNLLTDTERVMLAKRLAAVVLFVEGASTYRVQRILALSPSTAARFRNDIERGVYRSVEKHFRTKKEREAFWRRLEKWSRMGLPEMGRGRWRWLDEVYGNAYAKK